MSTLRHALRLFIIGLTLLAAVAAPTAAAAATCPYQARCGSITVPLDHSGATPGTLPLGYAILPATGTKTGTIFFLSGGPGESAVVYTGMIRKELAPLRATHDIVMVDQRGTGRSGAVNCKSMRSVAGCAKKLGARRAVPDHGGDRAATSTTCARRSGWRRSRRSASPTAPRSRASTRAASRTARRR